MYKIFFKRFIDIILSGFALIVLSPIILLLWIWLTFANKGASAFFAQERPGLNEKIFKIYKFKSMTDERDSEGNLLPDIKRLTKIGKFIRKTSLDEIPQMWNVLIGDMSLIGPRPLLSRYLMVYTDREKLRHTVRPGITGLAQISGRNGLSWSQRLELDAQYAEKISFLLDLKIICKTIIKVIKHEGVIVEKKENYLDIERQNNTI